jgi:HPt (histidine-containing phosphotransfer) domain-containing protein
MLNAATLDELRASVGDDPEFVAELIDDFLNDAPIQLETLRTAAAAGDAPTARRAAHTLKGNSRTFGAPELAALCQEAETAAHDGDLEAVLSRLDPIGEEWTRVRDELIAFRDSGR